MKKFADLNRGAERAIVAQQKAAKEEIAKSESIREKDTALRVAAAEKAAAEKEAFMRKYEERVSRGLAAAAADAEDLKATKRATVAQVKDQHRTVKDKFRETLPYHVSVTEKVQMEAKQSLQMRSGTSLLKGSLPPSQYPTAAGAPDAGTVETSA